MFHHLASIPFATVVFLYLWALTVSHGSTVLSAHLAVLAVSFFYLCTPLPSVLFLFGLLPGSLKGHKRFPLYLWAFFLIFNLLSLLSVPHLYARTLTTSMLKSVLENNLLRILVFIMSGGSLLFHWAVGSIENRYFRMGLHLAALSCSALIFIGLYRMHLDKIVSVLNAGKLNY